MNLPPDEILNKVSEWMTYADEDLLAAKHLLTLNRRIPYRLVAWHAQQCVEKYLKAYLVFHVIDFPHTHRILYLLELCPDRGIWDDQLIEAETLTPYAVMTRYPGEDEPVTDSESRNALAIAQKVRSTIRTVLARKGFDFPDPES